MLAVLGVVFAGASESPIATYVRSVDGEGSSAGKLSAPGGVATDAKGNVWVVDTGHNRVQEFNSKGEFVSQFGAKGSGNGLFLEPRALALDSEGNVWVADAGNYRVQEFNSEGKFIRTFGSNGTADGKFKSLQGIATDSKGHVWTIDAALLKPRVQEFNSKGEFIAKFGAVGAENGQLQEPQGIATDSAGNVWVADTANNRVQEFNSEGKFTRKFGSAGTGSGQFKAPTALSVDPEGNVWVADTGHNRIQEFDSEGKYLSQFGTAGNGNGQLSEPKGIVTDSKGNVWTADTGNNRIQENTASEFVLKFGGEGSEAGQLSSPGGIAVDSKGNTWVADTGHNRIQEFDSEGEFICQFGAKGSADGLLSEPQGIAIDASGNVWVADTGNYRAQEFNPKGEFIRKVGSKGASSGQFLALQDLVVDPEGHIWTVEPAEIKPRVQEFSAKGEFIRKIGPSLGTGNGQFKEPQGIATDSEGNVWVADTGNNRVQEFNSKGEYLGKFGSEGSGNGQLKSPSALMVDSEGKLWVADTANHRMQRFSVKGEYLSQFGTAGNNDGQFSEPQGVATDSKGNVWVADTGNDRVQESTASEFVRKFGGEGSGAGQLSAPGGVATDSKGNAWVADTGHDRIQEFDSVGEFIRQFGAKGSGNGQFSEPKGIAIDPEGNIWVADSGNHRLQEFNPKGEFIGKFGSAGKEGGQFESLEDVAIDPEGHLWTVESSPPRVQEFAAEGKFLGQFGSSGTGNGQFKEPQGIATDSKGNVWVADTGNNRIQEFNPKGEYLTKFGTEGTGNGQLDAPTALAVDPESNIWVADANNRVQKFSGKGTYLGQFGTPGNDNGELSEPQGIATESEHVIWVADTGNDRAQEWSYGAPPIVNTEPAAEVSQHEATFSATVNPGGLKTTYQFEYTPTNDFEENGYANAISIPTSPKGIGSGLKDIKVSETPAGLEPDTAYQFRIVAENIADLTKGEDQSFTTSEWASLSEPSASNTSNYNDIWCLSSANCVAVGGWDASGANQAQVKHWGGTVWAAQEAPVPTGSSLSELDGVTCTSSSSCIAVGSYVHEEKETKTLAMNWDGDQWSIMTTPNPSGASSSELSEIACSSAEECMAVGKYTDAEETQKTLAMEWNGSSWSIVSTPNASGGSRNELSGVSCRPAYCLAVGSFVNSGEVTKTLAMTWDGKEWSVESTPEPSGAALNQLAGVTCISSTECIAVGTYFDSSGTQKTLILVRLAGGWGIASSPNPSGALSSQLSAVSCTSSSACTAVGSYKEPSGEVPLAMRWNGTAWLEQSADTESFGAVSLEYSGVSCPASSSCHSVGSITYGHGGVRKNLAFAWNGSEWALTEANTLKRKWLQESVTPVDNGLSGVQCFGALEGCIITGTFTDGFGAKRGHAHAGSDEMTPEPGGAISSEIDALACVSDEQCIAAGSYHDSSDVKWGLTLQRTGTSWSVLGVPAPTEAKSSWLEGVSCSSDTSCMAVGGYESSTGIKTMLALIWDGSEWSVTPTTPPSNALSSELVDVSCANASSCAAVGRYVDSEGEPRFLALSWNGSVWVQVEVASGIEASASHLTAVDCPSTSRCVAIGSYVDTEGVVRVLALRSTEKEPQLEWESVSTPDRGDGTVATVNDVSCQTSTSCVAVGAVNENGGTLPLTLTWDGTVWSDLNLGAPSGIGASGYRLRSVSCVSTTRCKAVGSVTTVASREEDFTYDFVEEGGKWQVAGEAGGPSAARLNGVSCVRTPSSTDAACVAVGDGEDPSGSGGQSWMLVGSSGWKQVPFGSETDTINDVDCSAPNACTAVGSAGSSWTVRHWDGSSWSAESPPAISGSTRVAVSGVSCPSATSCTAAGYYDGEGEELTPLIATWDGSTWSVASIPSELSGEQVVLSDVSCAVAGSCVAVGKTVGGDYAAVERWDGSSWKVESIPSTTESTAAELKGVSCSSATTCTAVGTYAKTGSTTKHGLIVRWDGISWTPQTSPSVGKSGSTSLIDVSCFSSSGCVALAEAEPDSMIAWDGTKWAEETVSGGSTESSIEAGGAVSCASAGDCMAVGASKSAGGAVTPFAMEPVEDRSATLTATSAETGLASVTLTSTQESQIEEVMTNDPTLQAKIGSAAYSAEVGPWTEQPTEGENVLIGAVAYLTLEEPATWPKSEEWPTVVYESPTDEQSFEAASVTASASEISVLEIGIVAVSDGSGNFVDGEIVHLGLTEFDGGTYKTPPTTSVPNYESLGY